MLTESYVEEELNTSLRAIAEDFYSGVFEKIDSDNSELSKALVTREIDNFLPKISPNHSLFSLTLKLQESVFRRNRIFCPEKNFVDRTACQRILDSYFSTIIFRLNKLFTANPRRKSSTKSIQYFCSFDFLNKKKPQLLTAPHIHAVIAVPAECLEKFNDTLIEVQRRQDSKVQSQPEFLLNIDAIKRKHPKTFAEMKSRRQKPCLLDFEITPQNMFPLLPFEENEKPPNRIHSVFIQPLSRQDLPTWTAYVFKEEINSLCHRRSLTNPDQPVRNAYNGNLLNKIEKANNQPTRTPI